MLENFALGPDGATIETEDFTKILDRHDASKKEKITASRRGGILNIGEIGGLKAQKGGGNYSREERTNALEVAEKIKKRM